MVEMFGARKHESSGQRTTLCKDGRLADETEPSYGE